RARGLRARGRPARRRGDSVARRDRRRAGVAAASLESRDCVPPARRPARLLSRAAPVRRDQRAPDRAVRGSRSAEPGRARAAHDLRARTYGTAGGHDARAPASPRGYFAASAGADPAGAALTLPPARARGASEYVSLMRVVCAGPLPLAIFGSLHAFARSAAQP